MLARFVPQWLGFAALATSLSLSSAAEGQTPPSRQNQPVPPSVHLPPAAQRLPARATEFTLSDQGASVSQPQTGGASNAGIQPASYVQDGEGRPQVPDLLRGNQKLLPESEAVKVARRQMLSDEGLGSRNGQPETAMPVAEPITEMPSANQEGNRVGPQAKPVSSPAVAGGDEFERRLPVNPLETSGNPSTAPMTANPSNRRGEQGIPNALPAMPETLDGNAIQPTRFLTPAMGASGTDTISAVRAKENPLVAMTMPAIEIQAYGPTTIGIHKRAQYRVVVQNMTDRDAEQLLVTVHVPQWLKLENVSTTVGRRDVANDQRSAAINWVIDRVSAGSAQTMTIDAIPSKAENFDFAIDWAMQTRSGSSKISVTEPRLEMNIAGPNEVMYGETAVYQVSVRNPGTGTAENVSVMLPEALGGERASLGEIAPGQEKTFQVELLARAAGQLDLSTTAAGLGELQTQATRSIIVRRPALNISLVGPPLKYSGSVGVYEVSVTNTGDAIARDLSAALALPPGVRYLEGIEGAEVIDNAMRWTIGTLDVGDTRTYKVSCQLQGEGQMQLELGARGSSDIAAVAQCLTQVETVADVVLTVEDPKGPLPTGQKIDYIVRIKNRGSRASSGLNLVMQFSEGIEPTSAQGLTNKVVPGQVIFSPITNIEPGQEMVVQVTAQALNSGTHRFRAQLSGIESDEHEVTEGSTQFYGETIRATNTAEAPSSAGGGFDR